MAIRERLRKIQERIQRASEKVGRNPSEVTLVLVTKNVPIEQIEEAYEAGFRDFGENRVQEFLKKKPLLPSDIHWHFIGSLQTNKVKSIAGEITLLHSLDRMTLVEEIEKQAEKRNLMTEALVEVNTTGEITKSGFPPEKVAEALEKLGGSSRIRIRGLMTIGPIPKGGTDLCACFRRLRLLRDELKDRFPNLDLRHLSMGMSADFETAIEEGATIVRIGTAVFGGRLEI